MSVLEVLSAGEPEEDEDCYMDGPNLVFTEVFHRKRGYCCGSGCRHCPYSEEERAAAQQGNGTQRS